MQNSFLQGQLFASSLRWHEENNWLDYQQFMYERSMEPWKVLLPGGDFIEDEIPKKKRTRPSKRKLESPEKDGLSLAAREEEALKMVFAKGIIAANSISVSAAFELYIDAAKRTAGASGNEDEDDALTSAELKNFRIYLAMILLPEVDTLSNSAKLKKAAEIKSVLKSVATEDCEVTRIGFSTFLKALCDKLAYEKEN